MKYANGACSLWIPQERSCADAAAGAENMGTIQRPGMAYVPMQKWRQPYELETGFSRGTMFHELDKPFYTDEGAC